jgi:hypothetical protein
MEARHRHDIRGGAELGTRHSRTNAAGSYGTLGALRGL